MWSREEGDAYLRLRSTMAEHGDEAMLDELTAVESALHLHPSACTFQRLLGERGLS
jgi:hypothetical protein